MKQELDQFHRPRVLELAGRNDPQVRHADQWNPYELNGGNVLAYAQDDWAVVAADTRLTRGYSILKRDATKIHRLTDAAWLVTAGMFADYTELWRVLDLRIEEYTMKHQSVPSVRAVAELVAKILYGRRFFPYYAFCSIVGFEKGKAVCWGYDAVGSHEQQPYVAQGSASELMLPLLDGQLGRGRQSPKSPTAEEALEVIIDVFQSVAERDTTCGDQLQVKFLRAGQSPVEHSVPLRRD